MSNDTQTGKPARSRLRRLMVRGLSILVLLALLGYAGWRYVAAHWNADQIIRHNVIPQLEAQLGQPIEIGVIDSNYLNRVQLHNVIVGKDKTLPGGALFRASEIDISVNIPSLVFGRSEALQAINKAVVIQPSLYIARDDKGQFNLSSLFQNATPTTETIWQGTILVQQGTLIYQDQLLRTPAKQPLTAIFQQVAAQVRFNGKRPIVYDANAAKVLLNKGDTVAGPQLAGSVSPQVEWVQSRITAPQIPAALVSHYLFPNKQLNARSGALSAIGNIFWDKERGIEYNGAARLKDVSAQLNAASFSPGLKALPIYAASGTLKFDEHTVVFDKLQLRVQGSPLSLEGSLVYGIPDIAFDLTAQSRAMPFARWNQWLRPLLPATQFSGAPGAFTLRLTGTSKRLTTSGTLTSHQARLQQSQLGHFSAANLSVGWNGWIVPGKTVQSSFLLQLKGNGAALGHDLGNVKAGTWQSNIQWQNNGGFSLKGQFEGKGISGQSRSGERVQAAQADVAFSHEKSTFVQVASNNALITSPQWGRATSNQAWVQAQITAKQLTLQSQLRGFTTRSARYGSAAGALMQLSANSDFPITSQSTWRGNVTLQNADLAHLDLAAISPQLATHIHSPGNLNGQAQFLWNARNPQVVGQFKLSRLTVTQQQQKVLLRDINSSFHYDGQKLLLNNMRADSPYGNLNGQITADLGRNDFALLVQAPRAHFDARELNPYLRAQRITLNGQATGRLLIAAGSGSNTQLRAKFDLDIPSSKVLLAQTQVQAKGGHLRGQIEGTFNGNNNWQFNGAAVLAAQNAALQQSASRAQLGRFRLTAQGDVQNHSGKIEPRLQGTFNSKALKITTPGLQRAAALGDVQAKWQWQNDTLSAPRLKAAYADGTLDGHLTLTNGTELQGALLGRDLQLQRISSWLKKARPGLLDQADLSGTGFVKATLDGSFDAPQLELDTQVYDGALQWNDGGTPSRLPLDMVHWQTRLAPEADKSTFTIPLQQFTLWSGGTRLDATGDLHYLADKSTFTYNTQIKLDGLQLASALGNWPLLDAMQQWQEDSATSGVLNARLHVSGEGANPRINGAVGLRVAQSYGTAFRDVRGRITAAFSDGKPMVHLAGITGKIAQAPFNADLTLDAVQQRWAASADIADVEVFEMLDFAQDFGQESTLSRGSLHLSRLPFRGKLSARLQADGKVNFTDGKPFFRINAGTAHLSSAQLSWHNEKLGVLAADFDLQPDLLQVKNLSLLSQDAANPRRIAFTGAIPWDMDSPLLDTHLDISNARLSFISLLLDETRQVWRRTGNGEIWQQLAQWKNDLPPGAEGNISLDTHLSGRLDAPRFKVASFKVRDASARTPGLWGQGPVHPLPDVDAAGMYADGVLTIDQLEARLPTSTEGHEDLLLHTIGTGRVEPGGAINLDLELLHGQLQDLSLWVAALRNDDGSSALSGEVGQIALHVEGNTSAPHVIGSFDANDLSYGGYTLDRLRVSRFDLNDGKIFIRPGNFTVIKGDYQSSTGWGYLPWSWGGGKPFGLRRDLPMEVHLPLQDADFGALAGVFLPAVTGAKAKVFRGSLDITGTLDNPQFNGITTIEGAQMTLKTASTALSFGITGLAGTLRFTDGNTLQVDPQNPLHGKLISASEIDVPQTGNRLKSTFVKSPGGEPYLDGDFQLNGKVTLDMNALRLAGGRQHLAAHHYDLQLLLHDATLASTDFSGFRHANFAALWQTGNADPAHQQHVRWVMDADGVNQKGASQGQLLGFGDFTLDPQFGANLGHLLAVRSNAFSGAAAFAALRLNDHPLFQELPVASIDGNTGSIRFIDYAVAVKDVANGQINGTLNLQDNANGILKVAGNIALSNSKLMALPAASGDTTALPWPNAPQLDVRFELGEDVNFSSSNLQATLGGYIYMTGTPLDPLVLGTFTIKRGQAIFPGARARITEGEIDVTIRRDLLSGQLLTRTDIDATAEGRSGRYLITLHLHGPLDTGQSTTQTLLVDISSNPPLSRDEAFAQLLGTAVFNADNLENRDQAYAQMVIGMLSGPLFSGLENTLAQTLGLSSIALDYRLNEPLGIEVGKAVGDRLYLSYRRSLGKNPGEPTPYEFRLEYRIKGNWDLGLKLDEKDQKTLTLEKKWRF